MALGAVSVVQLAGPPRARVTLHVVGEDGRPIPDVKVLMTFLGDSKANPVTRVEGLTDGSGNFTGEGLSGGQIGSGLTKDGYYFAGANIPIFRDSKDGQWQPWNGTYTSILRKIGNPIAMYAKSIDLEIPAISQPCGYDLQVGDWVAPYGKGTTSDFIMTLQRRYQNNNDFDVTVVLSFSNPDDGIQETQLPTEFSSSTFKWPRLAPENGYQSTFSIHSASDPKKGMSGDTGAAFLQKKYFFRVRTVKRGGQIVSALYGRINEGIYLHPGSSPTCGIHLNYYLNPTSLDRGMEFDPQKDLFTGLSFDEKPREP